jgi:hypothetical protein
VLNIGVSRLTDRNGRKWTVYDPEILNSRHVASAVVVPPLPDEGRYAEPSLKVVLSPEGHAVLEKATGEFLDRPSSWLSMAKYVLWRSSAALSRVARSS